MPLSVFELALILWIGFRRFSFCLPRTYKYMVEFVVSVKDCDLNPSNCDMVICHCFISILHKFVTDPDQHIPNYIYRSDQLFRTIWSDSLKMFNVLCVGISIKIVLYSTESLYKENSEHFSIQWRIFVMLILLFVMNSVWKPQPNLNLWCWLMRHIAGPYPDQIFGSDDAKSDPIASVRSGPPLPFPLLSFGKPAKSPAASFSLRRESRDSCASPSPHFVR